MFDYESGQGRIRRQITRRTDRFNQTKQDVGMSSSGMDEGRLRTVKPRPHSATGAAHVEWIVEELRVRRDANEIQGRPTVSVPFMSASHHSCAAWCRRDAESWA